MKAKHHHVISADTKLVELPILKIMRGGSLLRLIIEHHATLTEESTLYDLMNQIREMVVIECGLVHENRESPVMVGNCENRAHNLCCSHLLEEDNSTRRSLLSLALLILKAFAQEQLIPPSDDLESLLNESKIRNKAFLQIDRSARNIYNSGAQWGRSGDSYKGLHAIEMNVFAGFASQPAGVERVKDIQRELGPAMEDIRNRTVAQLENVITFDV